MRNRDPAARAAAALLALLLMVAHLGPATAGMIETTRALDLEQSVEDRRLLIAQIERDDVRTQLEALGVDPEDARARVGMLTDEQIRKLNRGMDQMPAGADSVLFIVLAVFVVLIITDATGLTDIFPFIQPANR
jgi:predicted TIM-barrel enzyme